MRSIVLVAGTAGLIGLISACGGDDRPQAIGEGGSSNAGKGGLKPRPDPSDGGENLGGAGTDALAPRVTLITPQAADSPDDGVLSSMVSTATCRVEPSAAEGSAPVDSTSVRITLLDAEGEQVEHKASPAKNENEFAAEFTLATVPSGRVTFVCSASDTAKRRATAQVDTFVDHGPSITAITPEPDESYALTGGLPVEFRIVGTPLVDDDAGSDVAEVTFEFDGEQYDLVEGPAGTFRTSLPIDDPEEFPQLPGGSVVVRATNKRTPDPVTASLAYSIEIDGEGPAITITSPKPQTVVGGKVTIAMTIRDEASGVDPNSVSITRFNGDEPQTFNPDAGWTVKGDKYTFTFDSKEVEKFEKVQTTVAVRARDNVGNQAASGQSIQLYLDNVAPAIDLDPQNIRIDNGVNCSSSLDPVGSSAINDLAGQFGGSPQGVIGYFRAFVHERTNREVGQKLFYYAGTDQTQTRLYVLPDPANATIPLLVNKNPQEDDTCDDIGGIENVESAPKFTALKPLPDNMGSAWFGPSDAQEPTLPACQYGTQTEPGVKLCGQTSDMYYVPYFKQIKDPMVYVVGTPVSTDSSCTGIDWSFLSANQPDGWVCLAARVVDNAGNVGISPPIRVCVDNPNTPAVVPDCATMSTQPPTCTDGCTAPARGGGYLFKP